MNMKAEIVEGFQESEIRKVCLKGRALLKIFQEASLKKGERKLMEELKKERSIMLFFIF